jgi:hypothetical protein
MGMECDGNLSAASLNAINVFGEIERYCIRAALLANPFQHLMLPLFEMLYERGSAELWFYDEHNNDVESQKNALEFGKDAYWVRSSFALPCALVMPGLVHCWARMAPYTPTPTTSTSSPTKPAW